MDTATRIENYALVKGVSQADREALIQVMHRQEFHDGEIVFRKGDPGDSMLIILAGRVRIFTHDADGNEFTLRYLSEMFGEFAMLDQQPRSTFAAAAGELDVLVLHRDDFIAFLRERPLVGLAMMRNLVERVRYTTAYLQQVMEATHHLAEGENNLAEQQLPESESDAEIQELVQTFMHMIHEVQTREAALKRALDADDPPPDSPDSAD